MSQIAKKTGVYHSDRKESFSFLRRQVKKLAVDAEKDLIKKEAKEKEDELLKEIDRLRQLVLSKSGAQVLQPKTNRDLDADPEENVKKTIKILGELGLSNEANSKIVRLAALEGRSREIYVSFFNINQSSQRENLKTQLVFDAIMSEGGKNASIIESVIRRLSAKELLTQENLKLIVGENCKHIHDAFSQLFLSQANLVNQRNLNPILEGNGANAKRFYESLKKQGVFAQMLVQENIDQALREIGYSVSGSSSAIQLAE